MSHSEFLGYYPWQRQIAQNWLQQRERFAHAWLIHGAPGIGKVTFARQSAQSLLCWQPQHGLACQQCDACRWCQQGNHPDLRLIRPEAVAVLEAGSTEADTTKKTAPSKEIRVEQLRQLQSWFTTATHRGGWRVAVLYPAERLNTVSANALLKMLEEPPEHTVFLLVAEAPDRLLPTIVSRCRRLPLPLPSSNEALAWLDEQGLSDSTSWLAAAGGGPLAAFALAQQQDRPYPDWLSALLQQLLQTAPRYEGIAEQLEKLPASQWLHTLHCMVMDLHLLSVHLPARYYPDLYQAYLKQVAELSPLALSQLHKWLLEQIRWQEHPLNAKLLVHHTLDRLHRSLNTKAAA